MKRSGWVLVGIVVCGIAAASVACDKSGGATPDPSAKPASSAATAASAAPAAAPAASAKSGGGGW